MRHITLGNLLLGLDDLLTKRLGALQSFDAGKASVKFLTLRRDKIAALPPELTGRPLADELARADALHDGFGGALWFFAEAYLRLPDLPPAIAEAAQKIRAAFMPALDGLQARYDAEAKAAKDREPLLTTLEPELKMLPVAPSKTLYDVATGYVAAGKQIDAHLSERADGKDRKAATVLRGEALSRLNRLRSDLADALKDDSTLPADLEAQVFGYLDLLEQRDAEAAAAAKKKAPAPAGPSAPSDGTGGP